MLAHLLAAALTASSAAQATPSDVDAAPVPAVAPSGPELWHGARAGMTPAQVSALFPTGRAAPAISFGFPPTPNQVEGGGAAGWAVDEEVFGRSAIATYYFQGGVLLEVVVEVENLRLRHTRDNVQIARDVEQGLLGYYGPAKVCVDTDRRGLARLDCRWVTPTIQVGLSYVDYGGLSPALRVAVRSLPPKLKFRGATFGRHGVH